HHDGGGGGRKGSKTFAFDHCFWSIDDKDPKFASQEKVFQCLGKDILESALEGYNGCIFAYGQTGSGKSFTMMGTLEHKGIIPKLCDAMFERIAKNADQELSFKVEVSYMEIYNEKVHDLLDPKGSKQNLRVREHNILGPYVDGLSTLVVSSFLDIENLMSEGNKSRTVAATNMNSESSRSHAVFNIILTQTLTDKLSSVSGEKVSKLSLVDLAGSERAVKTGAVGERLKEGSNINKSLTTLGLVISALADQSSKNKFVPYRDSVLTWLLKDNLGGNSKTVMVATVSPSADNYEETLSTLRYADRAKRIVNHAVVNEDPNARIIRELREEVDMLKKQLDVAQSMKAPDVQERLEESEKLMKEISKTWEEKLAETERIHQERHEALEQMGISVETSGIKVEQGRYYLVNLNADPSLNELLVYYLKEHTLIGRHDAPIQQDIQLSGLGIMPEHCEVNIENNDVYVSPLDGARTCVNGSVIKQKTWVKHGDRILWGNNHFFRINCPKPNNANSPQTAEPEQTIDYNFAQQELMMKEFSNDPIQEAISAVEKQYEEDKQEALEKQRQMYERQMQMLRNQLMSPGTPSMPFSPFDLSRLTPTSSSSQSSIQRKYQQWAQERDKLFKQSLVKLREEVVKANALVREANVLAQEMGKRTDFQVTLQIPASNLSPNRRRGAFVSEPAILVRRKGRSSQVWSMEKIENKIIDMRDMYEERKAQGLPMMDDGPPVKGDPFYESQENHNLIGVANVFLECLFYDVKLDYHVPIISQQGEVAGKLHVEVSKLGGALLDRYADTNIDPDDDDKRDAIGAPLIVRVSIREAKGLPPALSNFVFCQYNFWGHDDSIVVPPEINPDAAAMKKRNDSMTFRFEHNKDFKVYITEEFIEHCSDGALSIEVWGHRSFGFGAIGTAVNLQARSSTIAERWSEVIRKIELWTEIHELNDQGEYMPVELQPRPEVPSAGVFQLRQGHSRRIHVRVKPVANSGTLPLICESITSVSIGCISSRSKLQKGLDSYQEEDLNRVRERWLEALMRRKEYLDEQIQKLINKQDKSEADADRERALIDQWVCLTEERNAVMVPAPGSGIPGAPADWEAPPDLEQHMPVIFLDLNADDMSTPDSKEGLQAAGVNSILPKEHTSKFVSLPIIKNYTEKENVISVTSWDSSIHDSPSLNRVTPSNERVYLILKAVVRLSHPAYMELVLRKRIAINIYTKHSITNLTHMLKNRIISANLIHSSGITYEVVSNIPKATEDLEHMETLAQMAASNNEANAADGETYIEKYIKGISAVESILTLDKLRQEVAVKELLAVQGRSLKKATSVPNIHQIAFQELKLTYFQFQMIRADSIQDLSRHEGSKSAPPKSAISPMGSKLLVKPMRTLLEEQHHRESKPLLHQDTEEDIDEDEEFHIGRPHPKVEADPHSISSDDFQDFESYQSQQPSNSQSFEVIKTESMTHSSTNDSLIEIQAKSFTPSTTSSGYGSQAVSTLTLSSEDSLSLRSIEDNLDISKEHRMSNKGSVETHSSDSDMDEHIPNSEYKSRAKISLSEKFEASSKMSNVIHKDRSLMNLPIPQNTDSSVSSELCELKIEEPINGEVQESLLLEPRKLGQRDNDSLSSQSTLTGSVNNDGKHFPSQSSELSLDSLEACAIDKDCDEIDPYSETAMEELERLGVEENIDVNENSYFTVDSKENTKTVNATKNTKDDGESVSSVDQNLDIVKEESVSENKVVHRKVELRPRPASCFVSSPPDSMTLMIEESMKRNSLVDTSDDQLSGGEDSASVCSFGSRADLDRIQDGPVPSWVQLGESVIVMSSRGPLKNGVVQFVGNVEFASGSWVGVELDLREGKNDGSVNGIQYFKCRPKHGIFVRHDKLIWDKKRRGSRKNAQNVMNRRSSGGNSLSHSAMNLSQVTSPMGASSSFMKSTTASCAKNVKKK
ncbi:hypothetical protein ScPMuIL_007695, partial [Solemya velum]